MGLGLCVLKGALKRGSARRLGLVAPRVFVIYYPPPRDLTPFRLLLSFFFFLPPPPSPFFFNVLIVPTVSSGRGERGGEWRGLSSPSHRGLHECSRCGEGEGEREEDRAGKLFRLIPALSLFFFKH